jgi:hypothetical protein
MGDAFLRRHSGIIYRYCSERCPFAESDSEADARTSSVETRAERTRTLPLPARRRGRRDATETGAAASHAAS